MLIHLFTKQMQQKQKVQHLKEVMLNFVPVVTLSINDNIKFLEHIKQGFERKFLGTNTNLK